MKQSDPTWTGECQAMCDALEANIAIICPCLPMVPSLIHYYFPGLKLLGPSKPCEGGEDEPEKKETGDVEGGKLGNKGQGGIIVTTDTTRVYEQNEFMGSYAVAVHKKHIEEEEEEKKAKEEKPEEKRCDPVQVYSPSEDTLRGGDDTHIEIERSHSGKAQSSLSSYHTNSWTTITGSCRTMFEGESQPATPRYVSALDRRPSVRYHLDRLEPVLAQPRI